MIAGMTAALLTIGCSLPGQIPAGPGRVVVHYGSIDLAPNADLALVLDIRNLLGAGYKVQQAVPTSGIKTISAKVTGPNLVEPVITSVEVSQCVNGLATLNFTNLPPGPVEVVVNAIDVGGQPMAWASGRAVIRPNETAQVTLKCSSTGGNLTIDFDCPESCGATPQPSPTPTPPPANTASLISSLTTFDVDATGRIYISGFDPLPGSGDVWSGCRVIQVNPDHTVKQAPVYDTIRQGSDLEVQKIGTDPSSSSHNLVVYNSFHNDILKLDTTVTPASVVGTVSGAVANKNWTLTQDRNGKIVFGKGSHTGIEMKFFRENNGLPETIYAYPTTSTKSAIRLAYDGVNDVPIWTCNDGIFTLQDLVAPHEAPVQVFGVNQTPGITTRPIGISMVGRSSSEFLFTLMDDQNVYMSVNNRSSFVSAFNFKDYVAGNTQYFPREIVMSPDGQSYYVLLTPFNGDGNWYNFGVSKYMIVKCKLTNNALTDPYPVVSTN